MKNIALIIGLFSVIMGSITYDSEIRTAPLPIITGLIVIVLALFDLVPEFIQCKTCGRRISKREKQCHHCGAGTKNDKEQN